MTKDVIEKTLDLSHRLNDVLEKWAVENGEAISRGEMQTCILQALEYVLPLIKKPEGEFAAWLATAARRQSRLQKKQTPPPC